MKKVYFLCFMLLFSGVLFAQKTFKPKPPTNPKATLDFDFQEIDGSKTQPSKRAAFYQQPLQLNKLNKVQITKDSADASFIFIENKTLTTPSSKAKISVEQVRLDFLEKNKATLGIEKPKDELKVISEENDEAGGTHIRMQQLIGEVPIYGAELVLHLKQSQVTSLNGRAFRTQNIDVNPSFQAQKAIELAFNDLGKSTILQTQGLTGQLTQFQKNEVELIVYPIGGKFRLAYQLSVRPNLLERWVYFVDAHTGEVLDKFSHTCTLDGVYKTTAKDLNGKNQEFKIYEKGGVYYLIDATQTMYNSSKSTMPDNPVGAIWTIDALNSKIGDNSEMQLSHVTSQNGTSWNATAVSAHVNATYCYNYYKNTFGRNSLNANGGSIVSVINIADEDGKGLDNAFWNGEFMAYGNGRSDFKPLAGALDVAGHEMTHGVVESTARLEYRNQSGAMNESFADIFGALIDRDDWLLGEDVVLKTSFPTGALRSLQDPNQGGTSLRNAGYQPKTMSQYMYLKDTEDEDNGGVHINSGIPNYAFYLFASNSSVGKDKAEKVYYQALTKYLTRTSKFLDLRLAIIQSAKDLYGEGAITTAAASAFDAVGIVTSGGTTTNPPKENNDIPVNPGTESLIVYDPVEGTLYSGPYTSGGDFSPIASKYGCLSKPSVTDDGQYVYFVGSDKNIYQKNLTTTAAPAKLTTNGSWRNVSVSKDGKHLAALTTDYDEYMYVYDLTKNPATYYRFKLYNPTYSQGVSTGDVVYSDSFEWDYTGEFIIYDAYNSVKGFASEYYFADVGIIRVWDVAKNTFGDGTIEKLFTDLEEGENIGNPSYSKTSKSVIIFDYAIFGEDDNSNDDDEFYIIGVDFSKSGNDALKLVVQNNTVGYPDYSKADDKVVFNADENGKEAVKGIAMNTDKISSSGSPVTFFTDAKWAVWYAQGQRQLPTKQAQTISFTAIADQQPNATIDLKATSSASLAVQFRLKSGDATVSGTKAKLGTTAGKVTIEAFQLGTSQYTEAAAEQTFCIIPKTPTITKNGSNLVATGGSAYQWYVNGNPIGGQTTSNTISPNLAGTYTVKAVTSDGCLSLASNGLLNEPLSTESVVENVIEVYPNPLSESFQIRLQLNTPITKLQLFDISGRWIKSFEVADKSYSIKELPTGTYQLLISTAEGSVSKKLAKQ